ncbi:hypothetical protein Pfo_008901 [Paulownia fortunei]|nr:hypothetical protein Pfo_008901 [Paulownia fortunei]
MDYTRWAEMHQNPNPNSEFSLLHTTNYYASYSHNLNSDPYQPPSIDPHNALYLHQPRPPGVDPPYVPPPVTVKYGLQPISFEPQQGAAAAAAAASYYPDPNVSWPAAITQFGATTYATGVNTANPAIQSQKRNTWKKGPKKTKVVQSAWCEVCKIDCNSKGVLDQHKLGKKHQKNLEKLKGTTTTVSGPAIVAVPPAILAASPATVAASTPLPVSALAPIDKPIIGPEENPEKSKASNAQKTRKKAAARTEDLESKRRKVLEGGAAADAVRACSICNVVCNSDTVFNYHLAGQKHASMIKKHTSRAGVASAM